jgi:hypothetical protein
VTALAGAAGPLLSKAAKRDTTLSMVKQTVQPQKRRGPVPTGKGVPVQTRIQPDMLARLDEWAIRQDDRPSRPEALRRRAKIGLDVDAKRGR